MFGAEDFHLSMEKELRLIKIKAEIDECKDVTALKENLYNTVKQLMLFQQLLNRVLSAKLQEDISKLLEAKE